LGQAVRNSQDGISLVQTAEGALGETTDILQRMRELGVQASSDQLANSDRALINNEFTSLIAEITRIASATKFGTKNLLDGSLTAASITVGTDATATNTVTLSIGSMDATSLGVGGLAISTSAGASAAIAAIDTALTNVITTRAQLGATQNRLEHTINNLTVAVENLSASESRIRDADFATEVAAMTRGQILQNAGTSVASQANQLPQSVLQLLRG
jgi:flagellin